jgi:hypothetical protein
MTRYYQCVALKWRGPVPAGLRCAFIRYSRSVNFNLDPRWTPEAKPRGGPVGLNHNALILGVFDEEYAMM